MHRRLLAASVIATAIATACTKSAAPVPARPGFLITNASVIDGSGSPARRASVRVEGDRIAAMGELAARSGETVIDVGAMDPTEAEAFLEERIERAPFLDVYVREDGRVMTKPCMPGLRQRRMLRIGTAVLAVAALAVFLAGR